MRASSPSRSRVSGDGASADKASPLPSKYNESNAMQRPMVSPDMPVFDYAAPGFAPRSLTVQIFHEAIETLFKLLGIRRHTPTQKFRCFAAECRTGRDADTAIDHEILTKRQAVAHPANAKEGVHSAAGSHAQFNAIDRAKTPVQRVAVCFYLAHEFVNILIGASQCLSSCRLYESRRTR